MVGADSSQRQGAVTIDRGEQIIKIVGDATGKLPDCFQLLRPSQLFFAFVQSCFKPLALSNVTRDSLNAYRNAIVHDKLGVSSNRSSAAVAAAISHFPRSHLPL